MNFIRTLFIFPLHWIIWDCFFPSLLTAVLLSAPILVSSLFLRLFVLWMAKGQRVILNIVAIVLGLLVLWWYYETSTAYFVVLSVLVYVVVLVVPTGKRGVSVGVVCVLFIVLCELVIMSSTELHKIRGSILVVAMKVISLAFDTDMQPVTGPLPIPDFMGYFSYCIFPSSTVFGPYMTYEQHSKYTRGVPLSLSWLYWVIRALVLSSISLGVSMCVLSFMFQEPAWNRWFAAYSAAGSFRYSHYYVVLLSECSVKLVGGGYVDSGPSSGIDWSGYRTIYPLNIELPRSLPIVVTSWNLPMHHFLKNYVFKPSVGHIGRLGAVLMTYLASAMLHGLNFQLAAVLLSIGLYAYIESVFRYKLSKLLSACIRDRSCTNCTHARRQGSIVVMIFNLIFSFLTVFHLAYLGLMFGGSTEDGADEQMAEKGYSMAHTLRKWGNLDYLSHWIALGTWALTFIM